MDDLTAALNLGGDNARTTAQTPETASTPFEERPSASTELSPAHKTYISENYDRGQTANNLRKVADWHKGIADMMLLNPTWRNKELAAHYGVSAPWMSTLTKTDAFRAYFADRLHEHQGQVSKEIISQAGEVAKKGLERIKEKLDTSVMAETKMSDLVSATDLAGKMVGLGMASRGLGGEPGTAVTVNIGQGVDPAMLAAARQKMVDVGHHNSETREEKLAGVLEVERSPEDEVELVDWVDAVQEGGHDEDATS